MLFRSGGFGLRGIEGKIEAVRYARENNVPYLGICLGMQVVVIEFARHLAGMDNANSTEFDSNTPYPVIGLITEWQNEDGSLQTRDDKSNLGGTMRLGGQECALVKGSKAREIYGEDTITERHRHRYEVNNKLIGAIEKAGLSIERKSVV